MKFSAILHQYEAAFKKNMLTVFYRASFALSMRYCAVVHWRPGRLNSNVLIAIRPPFNLALAVIAAVVNAKIMKRLAGLIVNSLNYYLSSILW